MAQRSKIKRFNSPQPTNTENSGIVRNRDYNEAVQDITELYGMISGIQSGPTGPQGPQGPQGVPGPVGPAGLNWQGSWDATTSYVVDDAVGFGGASWFCIANIAGNPSNDDPSVDTVSWALLAAQGATGPQGPQGVAGTAPVKTIGTVPSSATQTDPTNVLIYDRNIVTGTNSYVRLPDNAPVGKEVIVQFSAFSVTSEIQILTFDLGTKISINNSNSSTSTYQLSAWETVKFIASTDNFWLAEYVVGSPMTFNGYKMPSGVVNNITETLVNNTTSPLSLATLNSTYPPSSFGIPTIVGLKVYCPNIVGGGLVYIKTGFNTWVSSPITVVV